MRQSEAQGIFLVPLWEDSGGLSRLISSCIDRSKARRGLKFSASGITAGSQHLVTGAVPGGKEASDQMS